MINSECHIRFKDHSVYIHVDQEGRIICFKYDDIRCDLEVLDNTDELSDYIFSPFEDFHYYVEFE